MARVKFCSPGVGRPRVVCAVAIKTSATAAERGLTIYFSRGPDSVWVAEIEYSRRPRAKDLALALDQRLLLHRLTDEDQFNQTSSDDRQKLRDATNGTPKLAAARTSTSSFESSMARAITSTWRSRPLARQLSAEGLHSRVGQQPEGCVVAAAQAGISEHQGILVGQKQQRSAIDPELFCSFGRRNSALRAQAIHRAANAAVVTSAISAG